MSVDRTGIHGNGPILDDHLRRRDAVALVETAIRAGNAATTRTIVIAGWYLPMIDARLGSDSAGQTRYVGLLDSEELTQYRDAGYDIYYLAPIRSYALRVQGIDLEAAGVRSLDSSEEALPGTRPM